MSGEKEKYKSKKLIIFQSPADIAEGISIFNSIQTSNIEFAVIGSVGLYNSITSYQSNTHFISPPGLSKGLFKYIFFFYMMKRRYINFVTSYDEIIYPDLLNDVFTSVLIKIAKENKINVSQYTTRYKVIFDNCENTKLDILTLLKMKLFSFILNLIVGMKEFKMLKYNERITPYCSIKPDKFYKHSSHSIVKKRIVFESSVKTSAKFLYLDPGPGVHDILANYYEVITDVLNILCENGHLFIKKHPTHPISMDSTFLRNFNYIPFKENLPVSMIDLREFNHVIAIDSIGLAEVDSCIPISAINLFKVKENDYLQTYIKYMSSNSVNKIIFPSNIATFRNIVTNKKL